eukprot:CAMPEP_0170632104 /NCGR_PEP_ID=MMETSP0224-20130122/35076_1 /TAXON_ID=285029 /ORGANISM="Togula jolla, Strain CCCM 725" /LENGTH=1405 /DNA_ID=CAMNT_0010960647 /DNA_START=23 /DNA_END=4240 /DNA_ORIENTATION=+
MFGTPIVANGPTETADKNINDLDTKASLKLQKLSEQTLARQVSVESGGDGHGHGHGHGRAPSLVTAIASAIINYLLMFGLCCAYGMILFSDDANRKHRALGVKMFLAPAAFFGVLLALRSGIPVAIGGPDLTPAVFLAGIVTTFAKEIALRQNLNYPIRRLDEGAERMLGGLASEAAAEDFCIREHLASNTAACEAYHESLLATSIVTVTITTAALGLVFFLLGKFGLARYLSYMPTSVTEAFLACVGYKVFKYALKFCLMEPRQFLPAAIIGVGLYFIKVAHIGNPAIVMPAFLLLPVGIFYIVMFAMGESVESARVEGLYFEELPHVDFYKIWTLGIGKYDAIDFEAMATALPQMAIMIGVCSLDCLLKLGATESKLPLKVKKDPELQLFGLGNIINVIFCSGVGYMQLKFNVINYGVLGNVTDRRAGFIYGCLAGLGFFWSKEHFNYLPRFFLGSLLFFAGAGFVVENLWGSRKYLSFGEWMQVLMIVSVFVVTEELLPAVVVGGFITGISFILKYAMIPATAAVPTKGSYITTCEKRGELLTRKVQSVADRWLLVVKLKGYLFFGSSQKVTSLVRDMIAEEVQSGRPKYQRLRYVIFDCELLDGMDASAAKAMVALKNEAAGQNMRVFWSSVTPAFVEELEARQIINSPADCFEQFDAAVLAVEERIVKFLRSMQDQWILQHWFFRYHSRLERQRRALEPFGEILPSDSSRAGCPWQYCKKISVVGHKTILWSVGGYTRKLFLVHSGAVGVFKTRPMSEEDWATPVAVFRHGFFLNVKFFTRGQDRYTAVALEDGEILYWDEDSWFQMGRENPIMMGHVQRAAIEQHVLDLQNRADFREAPPVDARALEVLEASSIGSGKSEFKELPVDLQRVQDHIEASMALEASGLINSKEGEAGDKSDIGFYPAMPESMSRDLQTAFHTFAHPGPEGGSDLLDESDLPKALTYAGLLRTPLPQGADRVFTEAEFMRIGLEVAMCPFSQEVSRKILQTLRKFADQSGTVGRSDLVPMFRDLLGDSIRMEDVDSIAAGWSDIYSTSGRIDFEKFATVLSRFLKFHEHYYYLLSAVREVSGLPQAANLNSRVTAKRLLEWAYESGNTSMTEDLANEMIWAADWRHTGDGRGEDILLSDILAMLVCRLEAHKGELAPLPKMKTGEKPARPADFVEDLDKVLVSLLPKDEPEPKLLCNGRGESIVTPKRAMSVVSVLMDEPRLSELAAPAEPTFEAIVKNGEVSWRVKLHMLLEHPTSSLAAQGLAVLQMSLVFLSLVCVSLELELSGGDFEDQSDSDKQLWMWTGLAFAIVFTIEILLRLLVADAVHGHSREHFLNDPKNMCDLIAILALYLNALVPSQFRVAHLLVVLRLMRVSAIARMTFPTLAGKGAAVLMVVAVIWCIYTKNGLTEAY